MACEREEEQEEQGDSASVDRTLRSGSGLRSDFEIVLPQLTPEQRKEYIRFEEDDEGNIL